LPASGFLTAAADSSDQFQEAREGGGSCGVCGVCGAMTRGISHLRRREPRRVPCPRFMPGRQLGAQQTPASAATVQQKRSSNAANSKQAAKQRASPGRGTLSRRYARGKRGLSAVGARRSGGRDSMRWSAACEGSGGGLSHSAHCRAVNKGGRWGIRTQQRKD